MIGILWLSRRLRTLTQLRWDGSAAIKAVTQRAAAPTPEVRTEIAAKAGKAGGTARAKKMTKAQRSEIARKAAVARWLKAKKKDLK